MGFLAVTLWGAAVPDARGAEAFVIVDSQTGHVFEEANSNKKRQVASLTKIACAVVVLDWAQAGGHSLGDLATVPPSALGDGGPNNLRLAPGDQMSLRDLIYAALLQSDNVSAETLAYHVGGRMMSVAPSEARNPEASFVFQMNELARKLGMERTLFANPHGLDHAAKPVPYSTAADMARLSMYALKNPGFRFYVSQKKRRVEILRGGQKLAYELNNTNELVGTAGIDGGKTGRTRRAGDCLMVTSVRSPETRQVGETHYVTPRRIIVVLLESPDRFGEGHALIARGWQLYDQWAAAGRPTSPDSSL